MIGSSVADCCRFPSVTPRSYWVLPKASAVAVTSLREAMVRTVLVRAPGRAAAGSWIRAHPLGTVGPGPPRRRPALVSGRGLLEVDQQGRVLPDPDGAEGDGLDLHRDRHRDPASGT